MFASGGVVIASRSLIFRQNFLRSLMWYAGICVARSKYSAKRCWSADRRLDSRFTGSERELIPQGRVWKCRRRKQMVHMCGQLITSVIPTSRTTLPSERRMVTLELIQICALVIQRTGGQVVSSESNEAHDNAECRPTSETI